MDRGSPQHRRPRRALTTGVALAVAATCSLAGCTFARGADGGDVGSAPASTAADPTGRPTKKECTVSAKLVPSCGAWWGVTPGVGSHQAPTRALTDFEHKIHRRVDIFHAYHSGDDLFPTRREIALTRGHDKNRMLAINWKPDKGYTWRQVARGKADHRIDRLARYVKKHYTKKFWLVIHHEPEDEVRTDPDSGNTAEDFRTMFRHVVKRMRADGVHNALFTVVFMGYSGYMVKPWFDKLYPGDDVVDWVGYDPFATSYVKDFAQLVDKVAPREQKLGFPGFYTWSQSHFPDKPLMLSEWAVLKVPGEPGRKAKFFRTVAQQLKRFPRLKALLYFDARHAPNMPDGGNTSIDGTHASLKAYRALSHDRQFTQHHR